MIIHGANLLNPQAMKVGCNGTEYLWTSIYAKLLSIFITTTRVYFLKFVLCVLKTPQTYPQNPLHIPRPHSSNSPSPPYSAHHTVQNTVHPPPISPSAQTAP